MKIVLNANIYVSSLVSQFGNPFQIVNRWLRKEFDVLITQAILDEVARVLRYPRIARRHRLSEPDITRFVEMLTQYGMLIEPAERLGVVVDDESDNRYLECAVAGSADYLVTGDEHLLGIQSYRGVYILNPAEFVALLKTSNRDYNEGGP